MRHEESLNMSGIAYEELYVGLTKSVSKTITESDVYTYAGIIADINPLHVNEDYAKKTRFGGRIAHGMLTASFFSTLVGMCLPGNGAIYLSQTCKFLLPVKIGDTITATGTVTRIREDKPIAYMDTIVTNQRGEVVVSGEASFMATRADDFID